MNYTIKTQGIMCGHCEAKVESVEYGETIDVIAVCGPRTLGQVRAYAEGLPPEEKEEW